MTVYESSDPTPHTLAAHANLAYWRGEAGDAAGAVTAYTKVLDDRLRIFGPDHPYTHRARRALARWRHRAGTDDTPQSEESVD
jgi:hypothetical protein